MTLFWRKILTPAAHLKRLGIQNASGSLNPLSFTPCKLQIQGKVAERGNDSQSNQHLKLFPGVQSFGQTKSSLKNYPDPICSSHILKRKPLGRQTPRCCPPTSSLSIRPSPLSTMCARGRCAVAKPYSAKNNRYRHFLGRLCPSCLRRHRDRFGQYTLPHPYFCRHRRRHFYY